MGHALSAMKDFMVSKMSVTVSNRPVNLQLTQILMKLKQLLSILNLMIQVKDTWQELMEADFI